MDFVLVTSSPGRRSVANCFSVHPLRHHFCSLFLWSHFGDGNIQWSQPSLSLTSWLPVLKLIFECRRNVSLLTPLSLGTFFFCFSCFIAEVYSAITRCWDRQFFHWAIQWKVWHMGSNIGKCFICRIMQCHTHHTHQVKHRHFLRRFMYLHPNSTESEN